MNSDLIGEGGNVALLALTGGLTARYVRRVPRAAAWLFPLFVWLSFASAAGAYTLARAS